MIYARVKDWSNIKEKKINVVYKLKTKNHMATSIAAEESVKIQHVFLIKLLVN